MCPEESGTYLAKRTQHNPQAFKGGSHHLSEVCGEDQMGKWTRGQWSGKDGVFALGLLAAASLVSMISVK